MTDHNPHQAKSTSPTAAGFAGLLDDMIRTMKKTDTLAMIVRNILTLKKRQPYSINRRALTPRQCALLELMGKSIPEWAPPAPDERSTIWHIGVWNYGRILLSDAVPEGNDYSIFAWLAVPIEVSAAIQMRGSEADAADAAFEQDVEAFLSEMTEAQKREVVETAKDGIDHTDPVLIYVNDRTFTNFGPYNNLLRKPGALFDRLPDIPVSQWTADEKRFVGCFYWIRKVGMRGEEFNGLQLTPRTLHEHFDGCFQRYCRLLNIREENWPESLAGKAERLIGMRQELSRDYFTCRWVNGLSFYKAERFVPRSERGDLLGTFPSDVREHIESTYGISVGDFKDASALFRACVEAADCQVSHPGALMSGIEQLLEKITLSAIEATRSDVGMTRGMRDLHRLQKKLDEEQFVEISEWPTTDYFCGVFPSMAMRTRMPDAARMAKVLTACSVRMQYNSWHYMPGHFAKELAPRHYYYPPQMADTAIWSNQHHAGHVMAAVRHSVRSPAPIKYRDRTYFGMVDLRLFRAMGAHYTRKDLCHAMKYTEYLRCVYQAIADMAASGERKIVIRAFDKPWFDRYCSMLFEHPERLQVQATTSGAI